MVSKIEYALGSHQINGAFRETLFRYLNEAILRRRLRSVSRVFYDLIDGTRAILMFRELYIDAPLPLSVDTQRSLARVAPNCRHLTIKVGYPRSPSSSSGTTLVDSPTSYDDPSRHRDEPYFTAGFPSIAGSSPGSTTSSITSTDTIQLRGTSPRTAVSLEQLSPTAWQQYAHTKQQWIDILSRFTHLKTLTLRINGDPAWPGFTNAEEMLVTLRIAIESANIKKLKTLCLAPVHAMGIIHLRWLDMGTFGETSPSASSVWQGIDALNMWIQNPFTTEKLSEAQSVMFKKILYECLRSFAPTLRCLRFVWLGGDGPSPLTLHLPPDIEGRAEIHWPKLEELCVGNIILPRRMIKLTPKLAPNVTRLKTLRSTRRDSSMDASDSSAWVDVTELGEAMQDEETDMASSIYSRSPRSEGSTWFGGISRTSRDLQFFLDI